MIGAFVFLAEAFRPYQSNAPPLLLSIVVILAYALISSSAAIPVITYNARGVGGSTGRSSWIGCETEKRDYEDVVRWGLHRFSMLEGGKEEEPIDEQAESDVTVYCCVRMQTSRFSG
jgi:hypothetical protein